MSPVGFPRGSRGGGGNGAGNFNTTHWTIVLACGDDNDLERAQQALASLFQTYWYPLFAYVLGVVTANTTLKISSRPSVCTSFLTSDLREVSYQAAAE